MHTESRAPQDAAAEPRRETVGVKVSASEKDAVRFLALAKDTSESELFRARLAEIVAEADAMRRRLAEGG